MLRSKGGLADLKRLRQLAKATDKAPEEPKLPKRKRHRFQMPGSASEKGADKQPAMAPSRHGAQGTDDSPVLLSDEDRRLFRAAVRHVEKMKDPGRVLLEPVPPAPPAILKERRLRAAGIEPERVRKRTAPPKQETAADQPAPQAPARAPKYHLSDTYDPATADQDDRSYVKPGHGADIIRDLKRGKWLIGASLDLHGSTLEDARERFERFLMSCLTHDVKCVRIVHGKGHGSRNGDAVLKKTVRRWLRQVPEVVAYVECKEADGGAGAVQVLLKEQ